MAEFTPNYNLEKPAGAEKYYISKFNANADKIDTALKGHDDTIAANREQEEQDIADTKEYADNAVAEHNISEGENVHPYLQRKITEAANKALADAKDYAYSKVETDERISVHNSDESAHQDIRNLINGMGTTVQTDIENAIAVHNASLESHSDIRTDYVNYTDNAVSTHNNDPEAHGGKDVVYTKLAAMGDGFTSSMTHADILTAFQDGKNVVALLNSGGEVQLETDGANITGKRTVIEGDKMVLETYVLDPETNMFTKTSTKYLLDYAPAIADEAIADVSIIVDPESDDEAAKIGSAIIGKSRIGSGTAMGGADWNAQEGEAGYIANKPFGEIGNVETVIWEGDCEVRGLSNNIYITYPYTIDSPFLQEGIAYTATIGNDSIEFTVPIDARIMSKSKTFGLDRSMIADEGYTIRIILNPNDYAKGDTAHLKITSGGITIKKIDPKYIENSFVIDVDLDDMIVKTSADDIRNAVANKMPIYVHDADDYVPVKNYFVDGLNGDIGTSFDLYGESFEIACEDSEVTIKRQKTLTTRFHTVVSSDGKLQFSHITNLSWIGNTTSIVYRDDIYTCVAKTITTSGDPIYTYRNEEYGDESNGVLPLTVNELKITVLDDSGVEVDTNYTIGYTSTTHGIQTVPMVTFMRYDGSSIIGTSTITNGTPDSIPTAPERTNYGWVGWNTTTNSSEPIVLENITDSLTVYAAYTPVEVKEITDSWDTIIANIDNDTYKSKYKVGNYKPLDLGTEGTINMQIVGINTDENRNGAKVPLTFIGMKLLNTFHRMNPSKTAGTEGTGALGGWEKSEMRSYLKDTILPLIPSNVAERINAVKKISKAYDANETEFQQTTYDRLWIPGHREIFNKTTDDKTGPTYSAIYKNTNSRKKSKTNAFDANWWLRSVYSTTNFVCIDSDGVGFNYAVNSLLGVCLGFCLGAEEETISDDWSAIAASAKDGSYKTKYSIGDTKSVDLGTEGTHFMQLVAFDTDDKADGSGKAPMTWIMKDILNTTHTMNPSIVSGQEGTGMLGGYDKTEMKSYLAETIFPLFPADVRNNIIPVTKHQKAYDVSGTKFQQTSTETLWIPGHKEVFNSTSSDTDGPAYSDIFKDDTSRIKKRNGSATYWWLRSASSVASVKGVGSNGSVRDDLSIVGLFGVCPGFCF